MDLLRDRTVAIWVGVIALGVVWTYTWGIDPPTSFKIQLTLAGLGAGSIFALAGLGLVLTYKSTGVFNFAHGAIGVFVAYANFQLNVEWGIPIGISGPLAIVVIGPGVGMALERFVFRPLQRRGATTTEKLVATLGVFVLLVGIIVTRYTAQSRVGPSLFPRNTLDLTDQIRLGWDVTAALVAAVAIVAALRLGVGRLFGDLSHRSTLDQAVSDPFGRRAEASVSAIRRLLLAASAYLVFGAIALGSFRAQTRWGPALLPSGDIPPNERIRIGSDVILTIVLLGFIAVGLYVLFNRTSLGLQIRAVVDKPELAELASINANRVSSISWALGAGLAGLAGVLFAAGQLDPFRLTLFMLETLSVAVLARLTSVPLAITTGVLVLGVGRVLFSAVKIFENPSGVIPESIESLKPNFATLVLFAALLVYKTLDTVGESAEQGNRLVNRADPRRAVRMGVVGVAVILVAPVFLDADGFDSAHRFLAFSVIFTSIVVISGFAGQITLGQAGFAGLGAFAAARASNELHLPVILAMFFGGFAAMLGGFVAGWPALRRRGLFLALTTVAFGLFIYGFVLNNPTLAGDVTGLDVRRPSLFGWDLSGRVAFYYFDVIMVALMLWLARNLRSGRLGRALAAMRDSEAGATSLGIDLRRYKMFIFAMSAFMAGVGGAMLTQQAETFNSLQFFPLESLFWFAVVVVAGISSITGGVLAAFIWVVLDRVIDIAGLSQLVIGAGALLLGRLPGGNLVGLVRVGYERMLDSGRRSLADAAAPPPPPRPTYVASDAARALLADPAIAPPRGRQEVSS